MDFTFGIGSALQGIGNIIGSGMQAKQSGKNVEATNRANRQLAEYAYSKDLEQWHRSNLYNDPSQQMARLRGAGLNPRLIYGASSGGAAGMASQSPKYQAPRMDYSGRQSIAGAALQNIPNFINEYQTLKLNSAQIDNLRERTEGEEIKNGISNLNKLYKQKHNEYLFGRTSKTEKIGTDKDGNPIYQQTKGSRLEFMIDYQLQALEESIKQKAQSTATSKARERLSQFDIEAWENLSKIGGKEMQFALPFLKLLFN